MTLFQTEQFACLKKFLNQNICEKVPQVQILELE